MRPQVAPDSRRGVDLLAIALGALVIHACSTSGPSPASGPRDLNPGPDTQVDADLLTDDVDEAGHPDAGGAEGDAASDLGSDSVRVAEDTAPDSDTGDGANPDADDTGRQDTGEDSSNPTDAPSEPDLAGGDLDPEQEPPPPGFIDELTALANPGNVVSAFVIWETPEPATTVLDVTCHDPLERYEQHFESAALTTDHEVFVMGLWAGADCVVEATSEGDTDGGMATTDLVLPSRLTALPNTEFTRPPNLDAVQPGWTLLNLSNVRNGVPSTGAMVDGRGRIRWYHQLPSERPALTHVLTVVDSGVMFGGAAEVPSTLVSWDGRRLWTAPFMSHHEGMLLGGDSDFYHLQPPIDCPQDGVQPASPVVVWDIVEDRPIWSWLICDHYTPSSGARDWAHLNGVDLFPAGDAIVVSSRHQNSLFRVDLASGTIDWVLGYAGWVPNGWGNGSFEMSPDDRFQAQHAPEIQPNGNILILDNGTCPGCTDHQRGWSRAIEIAYDTTTWEAEVVWEFRPEPDIFAPALGDADRLENGNTLVTFGQTSTSGTPSRVIEVDADSEPVWELVLPVGWSVYRAERVEPYYGFVMSGDGDESE